MLPLSFWPQIPRQDCQEYVVTKYSQRGPGSSSCPNHSFLFFYMQRSSAFSCTFSWSHAQDLFILFSHVHSVNYTRACTQTHSPTQCAMQKQDTSAFFLSQGCRTIVILHQPFRNLLRLLFQRCRPEALVLQLRHIVYMIKCSICSYISWANSDKCYQSSYFSE